MKAFVTGATGLLGSNVVKELCGRGVSVRALARRPELARALLGPGIEVVAGDLRDAEAFAPRLAGCDVLLHCGGCYGEFYRTRAERLPQDVNVRGTEALFEAAARQGIRNAVYVSSAAVLATSPGGVVNEECGYAEHPDDPYFSSKVLAEQAVLRFVRAHPELRIVLLLPSVMLGPGDLGPTPTGAFVLKVLEGEIKFVLPGWHRIVDARDVASAAADAIDRGASGERFLLGGRRYPVAEVIAAIGAASGRPTPQRALSPAKLLLLARVLAAAGKVTRRPPLIAPNLARRLLEDFAYSSERAERQLGARFRPLAETVADSVGWFLRDRPGLVER